MQIVVSTRHGELNRGIQEQIRVKLQKLLRLCERITEIDVIVDLGNHETVCVETQVFLEQAADVVVAVDGKNVMTAVDQAQHKLAQQLRKQKRTARRSSPVREAAWDGMSDKEFDG